MTVRIKSTTGCNHLLTEPCPICDEEKTRPVAAGTPHRFREGWYEHIDLSPVYVSTRQQLRDETAARGLSSTYITDTLTTGTRSGRWF